MSARREHVGRVPPRGATPTGRKKVAQGKEQGGGGVPPLDQQKQQRRDASATPGHESENTSSREEAKEGGRLPKGWRIEKLSNLAVKIGSGSTPRGGEAVYVTTGVPLIRSMNVYLSGFKPDGLVYLDQIEAEKLEQVTVQKDDVLLNITGASIGRVTTAPESLAGARVNQHVCIIRPKAELTGRFL